MGIRMSCLNCGSSINRRSKYCDNKCQVLYQRSAFIQRWLLGEEKGFGGPDNEVSGHIRAYLKAKHGEKCTHCGWAECHPTTGLIPIQLNHIDGDSTNCVEANLEFLCPNCHSLTPTYGALNKGKGRRVKKMGD